MAKKILVADDDPGILDAIEAMLLFKGYDVLTTLDGDTVLDITENFPDMFLLDVWMPGLSGTEICKQLKSNPTIKHIPVILISANMNVEKIATEAGADDFVAKPFDMHNLISKIERLLN